MLRFAFEFWCGKVILFYCRVISLRLSQLTYWGVCHSYISLFPWKHVCCNIDTQYVCILYYSCIFWYELVQVLLEKLFLKCVLCKPEAVKVQYEQKQSNHVVCPVVTLNQTWISFVWGLFVFNKMQRDIICSFHNHLLDLLQTADSYWRPVKLKFKVILTCLWVSATYRFWM